jgi:RimJ/RimL family protein N-acetyltransferase
MEYGSVSVSDHMRALFLPVADSDSFPQIVILASAHRVLTRAISLFANPRKMVMANSSKYFLRTERLGFRYWLHRDLDLAMGLWGDLQVTEPIDSRGQLSRDQVKERLEREISTAESYGVQYWPIFLLSNDSHVGCCGLRPYDFTGGIYEIGFHIRSKHWRRGFAFEGAQAVMEYAFGGLGAAGLFAGHGPENEASRRLLAKLRFRYTHDEYYVPTGLHHPSYIITINDYISMNNRK